ncbi:MAG: DNA cytosine methyltransferase [Deferribacteres bacterium]|nr:DNA cytosine methyltransferase [Deferribacteres bacterium]
MDIRTDRAQTSILDAVIARPGIGNVGDALVWDQFEIFAIRIGIHKKSIAKRRSIIKELIVDNFAGGGGASVGIEAALGRPVDIAVNHDPVAIAMHKANHPRTRHLNENIWDVDPVDICAGRPVGLAWFSPDCTHFSKAKGGRPVNKKIRGLAWVVLKWAATVRPRIIILENVEEFVTWGPLVKKEDGNHYPCPKRKGQTFKVFVNALKKHGYDVNWRELRACDYGAPTIRKRLFLIARCDGQAITWPEPTHGDPKSKAVRIGRLKPWRTAAECIDWSIPCPSIFMTREEARAYGVKRPLAEATMRRIARGIKRYVLDAAEPFIVPIAHYNGRDTIHGINDPFRTVTANPRGGSFSLVMPSLMHLTHHGKQTLVSAFLAKHYGGVVGTSMDSPISTVTSKDHHSLVTAHIIKLYGTNTGHACNEPLHTVTAGGFHLGEVWAFLMKYYGTDQDPQLRKPLHTVTTKDRFGLVTVHGEEYRIVDIGMRMLTPRELFRAQGFPDSYIIDIGHDPRELFRDKPLTKTQQVALCGNSVCPDLAKILVESNYEAGNGILSEKCDTTGMSTLQPT